MQRWTALTFGVLFLAAVAILVLHAKSPRPSLAAPAASDSASAADAPPPPSLASAETADSAAPSAERESTGFDRMPDGSKVPELAANAPKTVAFAVILVSYKGAQSAPQDAPAKEAALAKARAIVPAARTDFEDAAKKGDRGSTADAGRIPRGVLEPYPEYVLFSLEKGGVHGEPVDTPRGYWIIKRTD
jgi:hypothetical protein